MFTMTLPASVQEAIETLQQYGHAAYVVGGCVRDSLRGVVPHDYDITTSARPEEVAAAFCGRTLIETGRKHGTQTLHSGGMDLEITTFRTDGVYEDHRHPAAVTFARTLEEDLARRDFTINAMAYHPQCGLVDLFGGEADLAAGVIRCVGAPAQRFDEDALRMLRALRFAAVLGFEIEADTAGALLPVFGMCLPELLPMQGFAQQNPHHIYDVWHHTLAVVAAIPPQPHLRLTALLHDVGKPDCFTADESGIGHFYQHASIGAEMTRSILRRLKFDNDTTARVVTLVRWHDRQIEPTAKAVKRALQQFGQESFFDLLALKRADNRGQAPAYAARQADYDRLAAIAAEILTSGACFSRKELAVTGRDLIAAGMPAGRELGVALDTLLDAVIDEKVINEKEALLRYLFSNESH